VVEKMKGKSIVLVFLLLFGFVMFPEPAVAGYVSCDGISSSATICYRGTDPLGEWTVEAWANDSTCGQDKEGNDILCTSFYYRIVDHPVGVNPNQANVKIPVCETGDFSLVSPTDRSIKIRICDPNSGLWCNDLLSRAITADALKNYPNIPTDFNFSVTPASIVETTLGLVGEFGTVLIPSIGPGCCSQTNVETNIIRMLDLGQFGRTELSVDYGLCSSIPTGVNYTTYDGEGNILGSGEATELANGLAHCYQNSRTGSIDTKSCNLITRFGPEKGFYALADIAGDSCTVGPNNPYPCDGYGYFGWGTKIYQIPLKVPYPFDPNCSILDVDKVPRRDSVVIDGKFKIVYDGCGSGEIYDAQTGELLAGSGIPNQVIYLVPYDNFGILNLNQVGILVSGSAEGASFNGCSLTVIGGRIYCR
jgi:hypothetical protein